MQSPWSNNGCRLERHGADVQLVVNALRATSAPAGSAVLTLPEGYAPAVELDIACLLFDSSSYPMIGWVAVMPDGGVYVKNYLSDGHDGLQIKRRAGTSPPRIPCPTISATASHSPSSVA